MKSVFADFDANVWPHRFVGTLHVEEIAGGIPTDPNKAEAWLRSKIEAKDDTIRSMVAETMVERGVDADEATELVVQSNNLNGFKRDDDGLYIDGRQLKAAIKEAANVAWPKGRWGPSSKGTKGFFAEHVFVEDRRLHLGTHEASRVDQRFVHTWRGSGIQYEEIVEDAEIEFTVVTDHDFTSEQWARLWLTGEKQGIGASRSLGFGRYAVVRWDKID